MTAIFQVSDPTEGEELPLKRFRKLDRYMYVCKYVARDKANWNWQGAKVQKEIVLPDLWRWWRDYCRCC